MTEKLLERCPKCLSKITSEVECGTCGIIFEKYFQTEARKKAKTEQEMVKATRSGSRPVNIIQSGSHLDLCGRSIFLGAIAFFVGPS